jgi:Holliday junction resolvase
MANPAANRRRGAQFETDVLKWLRSKGILAERLRLAGKDDEGDLVAMMPTGAAILELKATARMDLPQFWREAVTEADNYAKARGLSFVPPAYVVVKRRNAGIEHAWVVTSLEKWIEQS